MDITFSTKLAKVFNSERNLNKKYGKQAKIIMRRLMTLSAMNALNDLVPNQRPERCHELKGDRKGQLSIDLIQPYRLIFKPSQEPVPVCEDGSLDWKMIQAIKIIGVEDYHG